MSKARRKSSYKKKKSLKERAVLPVLRPRARRNGPATSKEAAALIEPHLNTLQRAVLDAFIELGPMTPKKAERLDRFDDYGFSTIRVRITELSGAGYLEEVGVDRSGRAPSTIYAAREDIE